MQSNPDQDPSWAEGVQRALGSWYDHGHRDLPWREDRDAYRILVSETMLVQTTVAAVIPHFARFLARFPDVVALAAADEADVLKAWEGLGYYRRARLLHAAAGAIVRNHGGVVPDDLDALRALPGVGRYIAGAVLSFAYDRPAPIVEANTQRLLARLLAISDDLAATRVQQRLWEASSRLVPAVQPGRFNQAFMEVGGTVCTPRDPKCLLCPVAGFCRARALGLQNQIPVKTPRTPPIEVAEACAVIARGEGWLMVQRAEGGLWAGFWEFPTIHLAGANPAGRDNPPGEPLADAVRRLTGISAALPPPATTLKFGVTKHRVTLAASFAKQCTGEILPHSGLRNAKFADVRTLTEMTMGSATRKLAKLAIAGRTQGD